MQPTTGSATATAAGGQAPAAAGRRELPETVPLRQGLVIHDHGRETFILEDSQRGRFFKLGAAEACFVLSLIESSSVPQARSAAANARSKTLSDDEVLGVLNWLSYQELLEVPPRAPSAAKKISAWLGAAFYWRIPLGNPEPWLMKLQPWCNWLFSPAAMLLGLLLFVIAAAVAASDFEQLVALYRDYFSSWRWLWALVAWTVLKFVHELGHAMVCKRYRGEVHDAGVALILFMPMAYVNVNTVWRLPSRWQRVHVSLAGVAMELMLAGIALVVWICNDSIAIRSMCADVVVLTVVNSLLFNLNPLMKYDGYFVMADLTGIDNLSGLGQSCFQHLIQRYLLGLNHTVPELPAAHRWWIPTYGVAAVLYRFTTMLGMILVASYMFEGLGVALSVIGTFLFLVMPLVVLLRLLVTKYMAGELRPLRLAMRVGLIGSCALAVLCVLPSTSDRTLPGIVEYSPPVSLRSSAGGFIRELPVSVGEVVNPGQIVAILENNDLHVEYNRLQCDLECAKQRLAQAQWLGDSARVSNVESELRALESQLTEKKTQVDELTLRAPQAGVLIARNLASRVGTYLPAGEELATIGLEEHKRIRVSVDQYQASRVREWVGEHARVIGSWGLTLQAVAQRLEPRATLIPFNEALLAVHGGSLPSIPSSKGEQEFCQPRSEAVVSLTAEQSQQVRVGQRVVVRMKQRYRSLASELWSRAWSLLNSW